MLFGIGCNEHLSAVAADIGERMIVQATKRVIGPARTPALAQAARCARNLLVGAADKTSQPARGTHVFPIIVGALCTDS